MGQVMKIRTEKDVEALDVKLKTDLGIDVSKYRNPEVAEKFVDLLVFPQFVLNWTIRPILISLFLYVLGFYLLDLNAVSIVLYGILGFVLFLLNGLFVGILLVLWRLKKDIYSIIEYSLTIMKDCVKDLKQVNLSSSKEKKKENLSLIFLGVTHIVTIPMVNTALSNKVPLIGGIVNGVIKKPLRLVASKISFESEERANGKEIVSEDPKAVVSSYIKTIDASIAGLDKVLTIVLRASRECKLNSV